MSIYRAYEPFYNRSLDKWFVYMKPFNNNRWKEFMRVDSKEAAYLAADECNKPIAIFCKAMVGIQEGCGNCPKCRYHSKSLSKISL